MALVRVVPGLNPGEDRQPGLGLRLPDPAINELTLQRRKEALCHRIVLKLSTVSMLGRSPISLNCLPNATPAR